MNEALLVPGALASLRGGWSPLVILGALALVLEALAGKGPKWHLFAVKEGHPVAKDTSGDVRRISGVTATMKEAKPSKAKPS